MGAAAPPFLLKDRKVAYSEDKRDPSSYSLRERLLNNLVTLDPILFHRSWRTFEGNVVEFLD